MTAVRLRPDDGDPLRIQFAIHHDLDPNSGAPGSTYRLAAALKSLGHEASIYSFDDLSPHLGFRAKQVMFPVHVARLYGRCRRAGIDVLDASTGDAWLVGLRPRRGVKPLLVTMSHGLEHQARDERVESARLGLLQLSWKYPLYWGGLHLREVSLSLRRADRVLFLNPGDVDYAVDRLGVDPARIRIVANGLDAEFIGSTREETPTEPDSRIGIAQIATYLPKKGVHYSAEALRPILRDYPNVYVSLLGTGVPAERVLAGFDLAVHDRVKVIERFRTEDLPALLRGHFIKLLPSLYEGFGVALIEAMACGLAPVTTAIAGPSRIVTNGKSGLLVPTRDAAAIENALRSLLDDRNRLDDLRTGAWTAAQEYAIERVAEQRISIYREAIAQGVLGG